MLELKMEKPLLVYRWDLKKMLYMIPTPGTKEFAPLCQALQPFGLSPTGIEANFGSRLDQVLLSFNLDSQLLLLSYNAIEIRNNEELSLENILSVKKLINATLASLTIIDSEVIMGDAFINSSFHVTFPIKDVDALLRKKTNDIKLPEKIELEGLSYKISKGEGVPETRITITRSFYTEGLFIDFRTKFFELENQDTIFDEFVTDFKTAIDFIGLALKINNN